MVIGKLQPEGPKFQREMKLAEFPTAVVDPEGWNFFSFHRTPKNGGFILKIDKIFN